MRPAKVNQRSRSFPLRQENLGQKNMFDLSHDVKTTFTMGKLVPILTMEVLSSDEVFIRLEAMMRFAPLYLPIMHRVNMRVDYFYVPNRLLWPVNENNGSGWENFLFDPNSGLDHPYIVSPPQDAVTSPYSNYTYELPAYMGFPMKTPGYGASAVKNWEINAFPISAYYAIYDQYYRNDQVQEEIWEPLIAGDNTTKMPYVATVEYLTCKYRNWNRDIFTSATPTPQLGADVVVPMMNSQIETDNIIQRWRKKTNNALAEDGALFIGDPQSQGTTYSDSENSVPLYLDLTEAAAPIAELRFALMMQEYLERGLRAGDRFSDQHVAYFGEDPYAGVIQVPVYLGGKTGKVVVSEVMSTTETATLKVGSYAGQAMSLESTNDTISYHCKEHGIILGIISVFPDSSYFQGIERMWTRRLSLDYAWEQFALIGDEEITNKEVNADLLNTPHDPDWNDGVWGYNRRYYYYTYKNDIVSGLMSTTFISFHLGRFFDDSWASPDEPVLNDEFLQCKPDVTRVFQVEEKEDEIYAHIYNDIKVLRRLPKYGIPAV